MNRLQAELRRLYLLGHPTDDGSDAEEVGLVSPEGGVRAMVLELARPADWNALSTVWRGVQADLELPAPAIAISGSDGYQLWFSLLEPVPAVDARRFLESLRLRYLGHIAPGRIGILPAADAAALGHIRQARVVPGLMDETGRWSAYVAPDLAAVFSDEPWLDICPSPDAQADVLSRLVSIKAADFQMRLAQLDSAAKTATSHMTSATIDGGERRGEQGATAAAPSGDSPDPKRFLLDVMGDTRVELQLRIQAAQALLPYFEIRPPSGT
ncbi:hypothetical protein J2X19_001774 [Rhodoferax ferrireducens]|uniref:DUF4123 domain-containing protein n=1 Tax=Rhodoferax ferrireducens TaxID=192843 RepID=A0ABU2C741_9BURK|nr:hypothetical protein [Rhodoferax ferrireducens]MDR7377116.1 hypothetical protein [Rhodoferax ferrireducens]